MGLVNRPLTTWGAGALRARASNVATVLRMSDWLAGVSDSVYLTHETIEDVRVPARYNELRAGSFHWKRKEGAAGTFDRTALDGSVWELNETNLVPQMFGAKADNETDDVAAFNLMFSYYRSRTTASPGSTKPVVLGCIPGAQHKIGAPGINASGIAIQNFAFYGRGATLRSTAAGIAVIDLMGSFNLYWSDLVVVCGTGVETEADEEGLPVTTPPPAVGLQHGREHLDASRSDNYFSRLVFLGQYTKACLVNAAAEVTLYDNCRFTNNYPYRSAYPCVWDSNNTMDLDTAHETIGGFYRKLYFNDVTGARNWASREIITGQTSGAIRRRRTRKGNGELVVQHTPGTGTNNISFIVGETVVGENVGGITKTAVIDRISRIARHAGTDQQTMGQVSAHHCQFRKQGVTGWSTAIFGHAGFSGFYNCYMNTPDGAHLRLDGDFVTGFTFDMHGEAARQARFRPTTRLVIVDGNRNPVTNLQVGETLTGGSGITAEVLEYNGDHVRVTTTPSETAGTGTVSINIDTQTLTGVGTAFTTELFQGQIIQIADTEEFFHARFINSDTEVIVSSPALATAEGSAFSFFDDKFPLDDPITGSVSGAVGTVDHGWGPVHMIEVTSSAAYVMRDCFFSDAHNHAFKSLIAKRGSGALEIRTSEIRAPATFWNIPVFQAAGGSYGPIDFHGDLKVGTGRAADTDLAFQPNLTDFTSLRRLDGNVYTGAVEAARVLRPSRGDCIVHSIGFGTTPSKGEIHFTGPCEFGDAWFSAVNGGPHESRIQTINGDGRLIQRGQNTNTGDGTYVYDRWYCLRDGANIIVGGGSSTDVADGYPSLLRMFNNAAANRRFGLAQIIESANCRHLRGKKVTLSGAGYVPSSTTKALNYAVVEWLGTANAPTKNIINDWSNATLTKGNFFINVADIVISGVGSTTFTATAAPKEMTPLTVTLGSTFNNLYVLVWISSASAQNTEIMFRLQLETGDRATPFTHLPSGLLVPLADRYCQPVAFESANGARHIPLLTPMFTAPSVTITGSVGTVSAATTRGFEHTHDAVATITGLAEAEIGV